MQVLLILTPILVFTVIYHGIKLWKSIRNNEDKYEY